MMRRFLVSHLFVSSLVAVLIAACANDDDGGGSGSGGTTDAGSDQGRRAPDLDNDFSAQPDTSAEADTGSAETDTGVDTAPPEDTGQPDTGGPDLAAECGGLDEACCAGNTCDGSLICYLDACIESTSGCPATPACPEPPLGTPDIPIAQRTGSPPNLAGGTLASGDYELTNVDLYTDGTFSMMVTSVDITSNGNTYGSATIAAPDWGFDANLDLFIDIQALGQSFAQPVQQAITAGGCYTVSGNELVGDLTQCGGQWPEGASPPDSLDFETSGGTIEMLLVLTRETIIAAVPEENRTVAELGIAGDLPVLFTFVALD